MCKLTDYQIFELVVGPAAERNRAKKSGGKRRASRLPTRDEYIRVGVAAFGGDPEALGRQYDAAMEGGGGGPDSQPV